MTMEIAMVGPPRPSPSRLTASNLCKGEEVALVMEVAGVRGMGGRVSMDLGMDLSKGLDMVGGQAGKRGMDLGMEGELVVRLRRVTGLGMVGDRAAKRMKGMDRDMVVNPAIRRKVMGQATVGGLVARMTKGMDLGMVGGLSERSRRTPLMELVMGGTSLSVMGMKASTKVALESMGMVGVSTRGVRSRDMVEVDTRRVARSMGLEGDPAMVGVSTRGAGSRDMVRVDTGKLARGMGMERGPAMAVAMRVKDMVARNE